MAPALSINTTSRASTSVAAWSIEAGNETGSNWIGAGDEDYRHGCGCHPQRTSRNVGSTCKEDGHFALNQVGRQFRESTQLAVCPAEFNRDVPTGNVAHFV